MGAERASRIHRHEPIPEPVEDRPSRSSRTPLVVQAELVVGPADDHFEREADLVAAHVVRQLNGPAPRTSLPANSDRIQSFNHQQAPDGTAEDQPEGRIRRRTDDHIVRRIATGTPIGLDGGEVDADVAHRIRRSSGRGDPLGNPVRRSMEEAFGGVDFGRVRLHTGPDSEDLNNRLGARAFTVGNDIHFRGDVPDVGSPGGQRLLAHELTHTIQQGSAGRRTIQRDRLGEQLPANLAVTQTAPPPDKHGDANDFLEHLQNGTGVPGEFAGANEYQENMGLSQLGDTQTQGNFKVAAGAMAGFDLVVSISKAIQVFTDGESEPWDKAEAALGLAGSIGNASVGASAIAAVDAADGSTADVANKVLTEIAGFVGIFQGGFKIVKQIVALAEGGTSDQEKAEQTSELIIGILETGKGVVDQINNFMSHLGTVASGVVQAAPAIGIAINCMDMIMNGINMG